MWRSSQTGIQVTGAWRFTCEKQIYDPWNKCAVSKDHVIQSLTRRRNHHIQTCPYRYNSLTVKKLSIQFVDSESAVRSLAVRSLSILHDELGWNSHAQNAGTKQDTESDSEQLCGTNCDGDEPDVKDSEFWEFKIWFDNLYFFDVIRSNLFNSLRTLTGSISSAISRRSPIEIRISCPKPIMLSWVDIFSWGGSAFVSIEGEFTTLSVFCWWLTWVSTVFLILIGVATTVAVVDDELKLVVKYFPCSSEASSYFSAASNSESTASHARVNKNWYFCYLCKHYLPNTPKYNWVPLTLKEVFKRLKELIRILICYWIGFTLELWFPFSTALIDSTISTGLHRFFVDDSFLVSIRFHILMPPAVRVRVGWDYGGWNYEWSHVFFKKCWPRSEFLTFFFWKFDDLRSDLCDFFLFWSENLTLSICYNVYSTILLLDSYILLLSSL